MSYIINYTSVFSLVAKTKSRFLGSSRFKVVNDELIEVKKDKRKLDKVKNSEDKTETQKEIKTYEIGEFENTPCVDNQNIKTQDISNVQVYTLNKTKLKRKCYALSRLEKSKKFMAFYSISFPQDLTDQSAYKVFNNWLTSCRKRGNLKTYLWVAERQKNGTIHFHLLTNDKMEIRLVNGFMGAALNTEKKHGNPILKDYDTSTYNGVDVRRVKRNTKGLINYIAKYISKNEIQFYRLPWHCSRNVSRLFTATTFEEEEKDYYLNQLPQDLENYTEAITDHANFVGYGFKFTAPDSVFENIDSVNEIIYNN